MTEPRRTPLSDLDGGGPELHGAKILRLPAHETVPGHLRLMVDQRRLLARLDDVDAADLATEALALLKPLTAAAGEPVPPAVPVVDEAAARRPAGDHDAGDDVPAGPEQPGQAELDAVVAVLHERDTDQPGSPRETARLAIAGYLAHRALLAADGHRH
ncbi:MAG: hypothetical protein ACLGIO_15005 [Acidimicrobiia bacterium]